MSNAPASFDFGLTAAEEMRAGRLHRDSIVFDMMQSHIGGSNIFDAYPEELRAEYRAGMSQVAPGFGAYCKASFWPYELDLEGKSDLIRQWYQQSGLTCGTHYVPVHQGNDPTALILEQLIALMERVPWLRRVTTGAQIRQAKAEGAVATYGQWQPVFPAPRELASLDRAYEKGLRSLMLTYNRMDSIGVGCTERFDAGLSNYGIDVVRHCNELGVLVDTSHCGHLTTMDACRFSKKAVNANHTSARAVCDVARGKSDDALKAIADTGGIIGVVTVPFFVSKNPHPTIEATLDHIDYIVKLVGWRHVAIGTDWPLQCPQEMIVGMTGAFAEAGFRPEDRIDPTQVVEGFADYRDMPNITRGLVKRGYSDEQIRGILGENALRVFADVCG